MIFGSVCSGIEAASVAWHPLGWRAAFFSEIEKFPRAVLAHHYKDTPCHGDFTTIGKDDYEPINLLVGGTPCQSFSVAGLRKGLADERGNLTLEFIRLAERLKPRWLVWENVPGVLSQDRGRAFGSFLGGLAECGYGFAYRVLDAQYFGVPQRRRRVFVVGYFGDWRPPATVLFERESLRRDITPRREAGKGITCEPEGIAGNVSSKWSKGTGGPAGDEHYNLIAPTISARTKGAGGLGTDFDCDGGLITAKLGHTKSNGIGISDDDQAYTLEATNSCNQAVAFAQNQRDEVRTMEVAGALAAEAGMKQQTYVALPINTQIATRHEALGEGTGFGIGDNGDPAFTLQSAHHHAVGYTLHGSDKTISTATETEIAGSVRTKPPGSVENSSTTVALQGMQVRRLTPRECERLQGFPDDYTQISEKTADGPRYKALGNSMAVPVMRWIGERIDMVEKAA